MRNTFVYQQYSLSAPFELLEYSLMPNYEDRDCRDRLQEAYQSLEELISDGESEAIGTRFNLCEPLDTNNPDDVASLYELSVRAVTNYFEMYQ